jgi:hypothetical protein
LVIRACRQGFVCQHKCVWNHVETPALKPGLLIWNSRAGSLGAITSRFSGRAAASTPSRCREVSDRRMPHGRPGFCRRAVRTRLAAGGRWIRTIGPCREEAGLYCGDELGDRRGQPKKFCGVPMVRIHLPPAASLVQTGLPPILPRKNARVDSRAGAAANARSRLAARRRSRTGSSIWRISSSHGMGGFKH